MGNDRSGKRILSFSGLITLAESSMNADGWSADRGQRARMVLRLAKRLIGESGFVCSCIMRVSRFVF